MGNSPWDSLALQAGLRWWFRFNARQIHGHGCDRIMSKHAYALSARWNLLAGQRQENFA
jgi:hypothetical protein